MSRPAIEHVIVLVLENRSFDHMLGFLNHPKQAFPRLTDQSVSNVGVTPNARYEIQSPDHSHAGVMRQLLCPDDDRSYWSPDYETLETTSPNQGFVRQYADARCDGNRDAGARIMRCFHEDSIPVLATLAKEFAVFTHWHSAVPGETWPNRDFIVAGTSFGNVDQSYHSRPSGTTMFERVRDAQGTFRIYHDAIGHTFLYRGLYGGGSFAGMDAFFDDVAHDRLPQLAYIEPDFGLGSTNWFLEHLVPDEFGDAYGNSQHPGQASTPAEFVAGEYLIARIYDALVAMPALFAKTLFLITYDEHGGFFDREPPPRVPAVDRKQWSKEGFRFDMLGVRVPAVLVSPLIEPGTIVDTPFEHASIPATVRALFAPKSDPLSPREAAAPRFDTAAIRDGAVPREALPKVTPLAFAAAQQAMELHGQPVFDSATKDAAFEENWLHVAKTANKLLPPLPMGLTEPDPQLDAAGFARSIVQRMQRDGAPSDAALPNRPPHLPEPASATNHPGERFVATDLPAPATRPLRVYAFDPSLGRVVDNAMTLHVPNQKLASGPVEIDDYLPSRLAVVDYDGAAKRYYTPVDLDHPNILMDQGLWPSESDIRFHQQMVYAVARDTVAHFESALGRRIHWRREPRDPDRPASGWRKGDIRTLGLYPHAMQTNNAFYSPAAHGILFGYFPADDSRTLRSLPGQPVFTCLSHDIIAHEMTHAILDGQRAHFLEQTNRDVAAFHEGFADLVALFRHFSHREVLLDTLQRTGGQLYNFQLHPDAALENGKQKRVLASQIAKDNPLIGLAQQFGDATGMRGALRHALGTPPEPDAYRRVTDAHLRGSILVASVFDAFFTVYIKRTADLWAIYRAGGGRDHPTDLPAPLANQLCNVAIATAKQFFELCVRAIDYCPAVDISFGEFLRAMITAEVDRDPPDLDGIREALMQAFRLRGIYPDGARFFSEDALCWTRGSDLGLRPVLGLSFDDLDRMPRTARDGVARTLAGYLGRGPVRKLIGFDDRLGIDIESFHPVVRTLDGKLHRELVVEAVQTQLVDFDGGGTRYPFRAAATLIIASSGVVRWCVTKPMYQRGGDREASDRHQRQQAFLAQRNLTGDIAAAQMHVDFAAIHGGL